MKKVGTAMVGPDSSRKWALKRNLPALIHAKDILKLQERGDPEVSHGAGRKEEDATNTETPANAEGVGQPTSEAPLAAPTGYANRNCNNCAHRDGGMCVLTGYHWTIQRQYPEEPCDVNLSGWKPEPPKKSLRRRIYDALWA